jgi:DNA primase
MVSFAELKTQVPIENLITLFDIPVKKHGASFRGSCPKCGGSERTLVITPGKGAYCWAEKKGGDAIFLISHIHNLSPRDAAVEIAARAGLQTEAKPEPATNGNDLSRIAATLDYEHEMIQAFGLSPDQAKKLGIGYKPKGKFAKMVVVPLHHGGALVGYAAVDGILDLPEQLLETL